MIKTVESGIPADKSVSKGNSEGNAVICPLNSYLSGESVIFPFKTANDITERFWMTFTTNCKLQTHVDNFSIFQFLNFSYEWNWHETIYVFFTADTMNSQRPVNRKNVLSVVFEFPYTRFSESCFLAWSGAHNPERRATSIRSRHGVFKDQSIFSQIFSLSHASDTLINSFSHLFHRA